MTFWNGVDSKIRNFQAVKSNNRLYIIEKFLGVGSFNNSYLVNGNIFLKQYTYPLKHHKKYLFFAENLKKVYSKINNLKHTENIIETFEFKEHFFISRKYEKAVSLKKYILQNPKITDRLELLSKLTEPLREIHNEGIVHTDLKPAQFLLLENRDVMLIDFDHCIDKSLGVYNPGSSAYWYSPEHIKNENISFHSDVFTFGMIVYNFLTNIHPFYEMIKRGKYNEAILNKKEYIPINVIYKNNLPADLAQCIDAMMEPDYNNRPEMIEIENVVKGLIWE